MNRLVPVILFTLLVLSAVELRAQSVNVALGQEATQSSNFSDGEASKAVDGNTKGAWGDYSLTHTENNFQAWWQVDLGNVYALGDIRVWNRSECCANRLSNFYVLVSDTPFASTDLSTTLSQPGVSAFYTPGQAGWPTTLFVNRSGRYVRVQLAGTNYLSLAEVEVFETGLKLTGTEPWLNNNVALGARASASSTHLSGSFPASAAVDGRRGADWRTAGYWNDNTQSFAGQPYTTDTLTVTFGAKTSISEINVFSVQDNLENPTDNPSKTMQASLYGLIDFRVEYSPDAEGTAWQPFRDLDNNITGVITGNSNVWRQIKFKPAEAHRIRVTVTNARNSWTRIAEVEAIRSLRRCPALRLQEQELLRSIQNPGSEELHWDGYRGEAYPRWRSCLDPHFNNWPPNGSQNLPVVAAAIGLFRERDRGMWNPGSPLTRSGVSYTQWWVDFLGYQSGAKELPADQETRLRKLRHFKGSELFSYIYDGPVVTSVVAARFWAAKTLTSPTTPAALMPAATSIRDYARKYLQANWYIYGLSAGNGPAREYFMPDPLFAYNALEPINPNTGLPKHAGHFLAMAGSRSNNDHWSDAERLALFDRAIQYGGLDAGGNEIDEYRVASNEALEQKALLNHLNNNWNSSALGSGSGANLYGLTKTDRDGFKNLIKTGSFAYAGNANYFSPSVWLANVHTFVTVRILAWNENGKQVRLSTIESNPNGNNPAVYAVMYREAGNKVTFLYPFRDPKSAGARHHPGHCTLHPTYVEAYQPEIRNNNQVILHPEHRARIADIPTSGKIFHLVIAPHPAAAYLEAKAQSLFPATEPLNPWNRETEAGDPSPPEN